MASTRSLPVALSLVLAACGTSEKAPASFGGTILGAPFVPVDATGIVVESTACPFFGLGTHAVAEVQFSTVGGICARAEANGFCIERPDAVSVQVTVDRWDPAGNPVALRLGTYDTSTHGVADANGVVTRFWASAVRTGPACSPLSNPKEWAVDRFVLDEVGPARLRGSASAHSSDGSTLAGSFDVPVCGASDAAYCAAQKEGCQSPACVP
jgi:catechol 2,3-dioxygenase-like lactoylglutathione lyase family enzyme